MTIPGEAGGHIEHVEEHVETPEEKQARAISYLKVFGLENYVDHPLKDMEGNVYPDKTVKDVLDVCDEPIKDMVSGYEEGLTGDALQAQALEINDTRDFIMDTFIVLEKTEAK